MKANELMIGDFVNVTCKFSLVNSNLMKTLPKKGRVVGLDDESVWVDFTELGFLFEDIDPIPLTPEILEKNGWEWNGELWVTDNFLIENGYDYKNRFWWSIFNSPLLPINSVHELQNALRLCGIEKEIKL